MDSASIIAANEAQLKLFYLSGEPETTQNYKFQGVSAPVAYKPSGKIGLGLFLKEPAAAGQLLLVDNAEVSCACVHDHTPYEAASAYVHSPKAAVMPPSPRIPSEVHKHLVDNLAKRILAADDCEYEMILSLDSHSAATASFRGSARDISNKGLPTLQEGETEEHYLDRTLWHSRGLPEQEGEANKDYLERMMWNIIANNAFCDKVRSLNPNEPSRVETSDLWGVWLKPSYINHSCSPNCNRMRVGDAVVIRAATNIAAGEELTLPYFDIFEPLRIREVNCDRFGFRCHCRRCSFERSIGKPYDDIQMTIVRLKYKMHQLWTGSGTGGDQTNGLLEQLNDQIFPIIVLSKTCQETPSAEEQKGVQPESLPGPSHPIETRQASSMESTSTGCQETSGISEQMQKMKGNWIKASFIEAYMALYALGTIRPARPGDLLYTLANTSSRRGPPCQSEEAKTMRRVEAALSMAFEIVDVVHRGNMLGQELFSLLLKASSRFADCDRIENLANNRQHVQYLELDGIRFFSSYYGSPGDGILKLLFAT